MASGVVSCSQMRAFEQATMAGGVSSLVLMERAGRACVEAITGRHVAGCRVAVLVGPGNNGGDGYVIARLLRDRGFEVGMFGLQPRAPDARRMAAFAEAPAPSPDPDNLRLFRPDVIVDALFGIGLTRAPDRATAALIEEALRLRTEGAHVFAVDLPTGFPGDGGEAFGVAMTADVTVTFHALKPVHVLYPGRSACGETIVADIGLGSHQEAPRFSVNGKPDVLQPMTVTGHKYERGHALVLAGGLEGVGAARLAARGALRTGAGLVTIGAPGTALLAHAARGPDALMVRRVDGVEGLAAILKDKRKNAVVMGPAFGVGEKTRDTVETLLTSGRAIVLDADALTSFAGDAAALGQAIRSGGSPVVVTPHAGEFARLFRDSSAIPKALADQIASRSKFERALAAAEILGATVIYKGADTVIAAPDGRCVVNLNAPPWLATAGSGDVLAGIIGGLLAQGHPAFEAACGAVWLHGEAGQVAGRGLIADDLPEALRSVFQRSALKANPVN